MGKLRTNSKKKQKPGELLRSWVEFNSGNPVLEIPYDKVKGEAYGFVYKIIAKLPNSNKTYYYIGQQKFTHYKNVPLPKAQQLTTKGIPRKNPLKKRIEDKESWKYYTGSCKELNTWIEQYPPSCFTRIILTYAYSPSELTYLENKHVYCEGALEDPNSMNGWISGKVYKKHIMK